MAGIDLPTAQTHLDLWLEAESKVALGQSYQIGNRSMRRADLKEIRDQVEYWQGYVQRLSANGGQSGIRMRGATPVG
jgi:hypothetical protein